MIGNQSSTLDFVQPSAAEPVIRELPIPVRRLVYRFAYRGLRVWWFIRRPEVSGVKCVLTDRDRILLVRHTYGPRGWDLPGGTLEPGEAPAATARREMEEELGLVIDDWGDLGEIDHTLDHRRDRLFCFATELSTPELRLDPGEIQDARWFPVRELPPRLNYYVRPILARAGVEGRLPSSA
jgi:8-oxo-dGTP pyrophosphatase MutT (NUDIX family)